MNFDGVCLITKSVPDLTRFYERVFDCKAEGDNIHAGFAFETGHLSIFSIQGMEDMAPNSMRDFGYGGNVIEFKVKDVDAEYERLKALNVDIIKQPATYPWGSRSFWFRDPDGNIVDFWSPAAS